MAASRNFALYAITRKGLESACRLWPELEGADLYVSKRFIGQAPDGAKELPLPMAGFIGEQFARYRHHVMFFSIGIAVRQIAPLLQDKRTDPAVICIDENAHWCVPVLSGHRGGANETAEYLAGLLQAQTVLTTASDSSGTLSVDTFGKKLGWKLDPACEDSIVAVASAVVNSDPVAVVQEAGEQSWWPQDKPLPENIRVVNSLQQVRADGSEHIVLISDRLNPLEHFPLLKGKTVIWRPDSLVAGVGCDRGTPLDVIEKGIDKILKESGLSLLSLKELTSIDLKQDEKALLEYSSQHDIPFTTWPAEVLADVKGIQNPSETVRRCIGVSSVAEAAALYCSRTEELLVPKTKFTLSAEGKNMTLAVCRMPAVRGED